jgi:NAD(P)-dependent dehydrogenase (short-subunit alcohol dehydrogenase family)
LALAEEIGGFYIKTDVSHPNEIVLMVAKTLERFGRLDCAVNCAGIEGSPLPLAETSEEEWDSVMNVNLKGLWLCMKEEIAAMREKGGGTIVNISTNLTRFALPFTGVYTASKAAVDALTKIAAVENGKYSIRINAINPGAVDTPMLRRIFPGEKFDHVKEGNPLGKIAQPKDIAEAALWLCSPSAGHLNGASIAIDGG